MVPRKSIKTPAIKGITTPNRRKTHVATNSKALRDELKQLKNDQSNPLEVTRYNRTVTLVPVNTSTPRQVLMEDDDLDEVDVTIVENLSPSKSKNATGEPLSIVYLDIFKLNGEDFDSIITRTEAKSIWRALRQGSHNINRLTTESVQGKFIRIGYELKTPIKVTEISNKQDFTIEVNRGIKADVYKVRLVDFQKIAFQIGDTARVIVFNCGLEVNQEDIEVIRHFFQSKHTKWLRESSVCKQKSTGCLSGSVRAQAPLSVDILKIDDSTFFGSVRVCTKSIKKYSLVILFQAWVSKFGQVKSKVTFPTAEDGIGTDEWVVDVKLNQHIPQVLPINGNRATVYYPGIPKLCKKCYRTDHTAPSCKNPVDWLDYVATFVNTGLYDERMFGRWMDTLRKYHPQFNRQPNDLRSEITLNRKGVPTDDLRRKIGESSSKDLRTYIGSAGGFPQEPLNQNYHQQVGSQRGFAKRRQNQNQGQFQPQLQQVQVQNPPFQQQFFPQAQQYQPQPQVYQPVQYHQNQGRGRGRGRGRGSGRGRGRGQYRHQNQNQQYFQ